MTCQDCGDKIEVGVFGDVCTGCQMARKLPRGYQYRERYRYDPVYGHRAVLEAAGYVIGMYGRHPR